LKAIQGVVCAALAFVFTPAFADQLFTFAFTGAPTADGQFNEVTSQPADATVSPFTRTGVHFFPSANVFASTNWTTQFQADPSKYVSFSVIARPGFELDADAVSFAYNRLYGVGSPPTVHGPHRLEIRHYVNGSSTAVGTNTLQTDSMSGAGTFYLFPRVRSADSLEVRIYGCEATLAAGVIAFDDVALVGATRSLRPRIELRRAGAMSVLRWPAEFTNYQVLATSSLTDLAWQPVPEAPTRDAGFWVVSNSTPHAIQFYRLENR